MHYSVLAMMGIKVAQRNIKSVETLKRENIGHAVGWTKDTVKVDMKDGTSYTYTVAPTGIYSAKLEFNLLQV